MVLRRIKFYTESKKKLKIVQVNITDNFCAESNSVRNQKKLMIVSLSFVL